MTRIDTSLSCSSVAFRLSIVVINCSTPRWNCWKLLVTPLNGLVPNSATRSPNPGAGLSAMAANRIPPATAGDVINRIAAYASSGSQVHTRLRSP